MSKPEVIRRLGKPSNAGTSLLAYRGTVEILRYSPSRRGMTNDQIVVFLDGKVIQYGPFTGRLLHDYRDVFTE